MCGKEEEKEDLSRVTEPGKVRKQAKQTRERERENPKDTR